MESRTLDKDNTELDDHGHPFTTVTDADDNTEAAGSNRTKIDAEEREINVKWQLPGHHDAPSVKKLLQKLIAYLMVYFPDDVNVIDSKQREWKFHEDEDVSRFVKNSDEIAVQVHPIKNREKQVIRWVAITRIRSYSTLQDWKLNDHFYSHVDEARTYLFPHPFAYDAWDTITIGFIKGIHAIHYPKDLLQETLNEMIQKQTKNPPTYQLIPQRITNKDKQATTKAYTVHCLKDDAPNLLHLLTHGPFRETPNQIFVPFKYKAKHPDLFTQCMRQQNEVYHKTWIIKIEGITSDVMHIIRQDLEQIRGVLHIVPSKRLQKWEDLIKKVPPKLLDEAPITFSTPNISSKRAREYQDAESDNDSYGSLLTTGTNISVMTNEEETLNDLPTAYKFPSYASAAASSYKSGVDTEFSSPTTSINVEWQKEKQELEAQIKAQAEQIERIQADLQTKISRSRDLEDQLAQAIELAHTRDARHEEMLAKFELLMRAYTNNHQQDPSDRHDPSATAMEHGTGDTSTPTTPDRLPPMGQPPPKRPNTNSSPHRHIYSIFRQQSVKSNSPKTRKTNNLLLTQPMDTDDDYRQPVLRAKSSKKIE